MKPSILRALQRFGAERSAREPQQESEMVKQRGKDQAVLAERMEALRSLRLAKDKADCGAGQTVTKSRRSKVRS